MSGAAVDMSSGRASRTGRDDGGETPRGDDPVGPTSAEGTASRVAAALTGPLSAVVIPVAAVVVALAIGAVLIVSEGQPPLAVYRTVLTGAVDDGRALADVATAATPLILIGLGYAVAYRARVFTIGAEGQYLVGALAAVAAVTAPGLAALPAGLLVALGLTVSALVGGLWSGLAGWLTVRFGASVVISSLMLVYIGSALLQWGVRDGVRDDDSFVPATPDVGPASLPAVGHTHLGFVLAIGLALTLAALLARHRTGFRITALGLNREAVDANEVRSTRVVLGVMLAAGALAGVAGFVEVAGVTGRLNGDSSVGFGWEAIIVALLGRLQPLGVAVAGLGLAGLTIGFEASQRQYDLPSSLIGVITALIVVFVVLGDALAERLAPEG